MIKKEKNIKMIVSDLDGTLLNSQSVISSKTKNILIEKKKHGKYVVIATGRTLGSSKYACCDFSFANYIITNNGAAIYDIAKEYFIWQDTFSIETAVQIFNTYRKKCSAIQIGSANYFYRCAEKIEINSNPFVLPVRDFSSLIEKNISVCMVNLLGLEQKSIPDIVSEINENFPLLEAIVMQDSFSEKKWIDVVKRGVSKSHCLQRLQEMLLISPGETVLFGDGRNDIEMLSQNGIGIAMKNALPEVKKVCVGVTSSNDENGIVKWLDGNNV